MLSKRLLSTFLLCAGFAASASADEKAEVAMAATHAGLVSETTTVHIAQLHMQHILNCLAGPGNPGFDKTVPNPCKGLGAGAIADSTDPAKRKALEDCASQAAAAMKKDDLEIIKKAAISIHAALQRLE